MQHIEKMINSETTRAEMSHKTERLKAVMQAQVNDLKQKCLVESEARERTDARIEKAIDKI